MRRQIGSWLRFQVAVWITPTESGFYAGTWASNASWGAMKTEVDVYFGFGGDLSNSISYDVGYIYFAYPDSVSDENDFSEIHASISASGLYSWCWLY